MISDEETIPYWDFVRLLWAAAGLRVPPAEERRVISKRRGEWQAWAAGWAAWARAQLPRALGGRRETTALGSLFTYTATARRWYRIDRARERLGYRPKVGTEEGVRRGMKVRLTWDITGVARTGQP